MRQRTSQPAMVRIAIAGAGGFAQILAQHISQTTEHALIVLSRRVCLQTPLRSLRATIR